MCLCFLRNLPTSLLPFFSSRWCSAWKEGRLHIHFTNEYVKSHVSPTWVVVDCTSHGNQNELISWSVWMKRQSHSWRNSLTSEFFMHRCSTRNLLLSELKYNHLFKCSSIEHWRTTFESQNMEHDTDDSWPINTSLSFAPVFLLLLWNKEEI